MLLPEGTEGVAVGQVVSYVFEASSRRQGPLTPSVLRIRHDLLWSDVVRNDTQGN